MLSGTFIHQLGEQNLNNTLRQKAKCARCKIKNITSLYLSLNKGSSQNIRRGGGCTNSAGNFWVFSEKYRF